MPNLGTIAHIDAVPELDGDVLTEVFEVISVGEYRMATAALPMLKENWHAMNGK